MDQVICRAPSASTLQPCENPHGKFNNGLNKIQHAKDDNTSQSRESDSRNQPPPTRQQCRSLSTHPQLLGGRTVLLGWCGSTQAVAKDAASSSSSSFSARGTRRERHSGALPLFIGAGSTGRHAYHDGAAAEECLLLRRGGGTPPPSGLGRRHP